MSRQPKHAELALVRIPIRRLYETERTRFGFEEPIGPIPILNTPCVALLDRVDCSKRLADAGKERLRIDDPNTVLAKALHLTGIGAQRGTEHEGVGNTAAAGVIV